jgi:hypothetical protein
MSTEPQHEPFLAKRIVREGTIVVNAPRKVVFPLLCPVRERDWLPGWQAELVYSESGLVEDGCLFRHQNAQLGEELWVTSRHEPEQGIVEFVVFFPGLCVMKLAIAATAAAACTHLRWTRTYTGLNAQGNAAVAGLTETVFRDQIEALERWLTDYCKGLQTR